MSAFVFAAIGLIINDYDVTFIRSYIAVAIDVGIWLVRTLIACVAESVFVRIELLRICKSWTVIAFVSYIIVVPIFSIFYGLPITGDGDDFRTCIGIYSTLWCTAQCSFVESLRHTCLIVEIVSITRFSLDFIYDAVTASRSDTTVGVEGALWSTGKVSTDKSLGCTCLSIEILPIALFAFIDDAITAWRSRMFYSTFCTTSVTVLSIAIITLFILFYDVVATFRDDTEISGSTSANKHCCLCIRHECIQ